MREASRRELLRPGAWLGAGGWLDVSAPAAHLPPEADVTPTVAPCAHRVMSDDELEALAAGHELEHRFEDLRRLARLSARLLPHRCGRTWIARPTDDRVGRGADGNLEVCVLDLEHLAQVGVVTGDMQAGALVVGFDDGPLRSSVHGLIDCGTATVRAAGPDDPSAWHGGTPVSIAVERSMPRVWSAAVGRLDLSEDEVERLRGLRLAVAEWQGAALFDAPGSVWSFDRLLGYPDETTGLMPERCGGDPSDWRLLLQLTVGAWRGLGWNSLPQRIYWWGTEAKLADGVFDDVRVFAD